MTDFDEKLRVINGLREQGLLCNATIISQDGVSFKVHSAMLMASSDFFNAAFEFGPGGGRNGVARPFIRLPFVTADIFEQVLRFAYLREINLTCANVWKILLAADFLVMNELSDACLAFMKEKISLPQCIKIFELAQTNVYMPKVQEMATRFTLHNLCKPSFKLRNQQRNTLKQLQVENLQELLKNDLLNAPREQFVWDTLIEWLENSPEQRAPFLDQLLDTVRIGLLPKKFVAENVLGYPAIQSRPDLMQKVHDLDLAADQLLAQENLEGVEIPVTVQPRMPHSVVLSVGGWVNGAPSSEIQFYDINADCWTQARELESVNADHTMAYHGLAKLDDDLYVIGGTENGTDTTRCLRFSLKTFEWEVLPSLSQSRDFVSVVALDNRIYAIGGRSNPHHARNTSAEFYEPQTNKWYPIADMNHSRSDAGCTVYAGKIYVVGGFTGESVLSSAEVYDPVVNTWELLPEMVTPRSGVRCVALRKHIYAIGGFSGSMRLSSVERLDPARGLWIPMEPMSTPRSNLGASVVGDEIIAVGGYNGQSVDATVEVYNVFEDKWHQLARLPSPRSALNVVSIEGAVDLAELLVGTKRNLATLVRKDRDAHRPEYGARMSPNAELPAGHATESYEVDSDDDSDWQDAMDPFGLALILSGGSNTGGILSRLPFFRTSTDEDNEGEEEDFDEENEGLMDWEDEELGIDFDEVDAQDDDESY